MTTRKQCPVCGVYCDAHIETCQTCGWPFIDIAARPLDRALIDFICKIQLDLERRRLEWRHTQPTSTHLKDHVTRREWHHQDDIVRFERLLETARAGDPEAQSCLGDFYSLGRGTDKSDVDAFVWYKMAADQGNINGIYCLAYAYLKGLGVQVNQEEALRLFLKAATLGSLDALGALTQIISKESKA